METAVIGRLATALMTQAVLALMATLPTSASATETDMSFMTVAGAGGAPLNVMEMGNPAGAEVLFIHGMGMSYLSFQPQYQSDLAKEFRIVAMDLRGHGGSAKPWRTEDVQPSTIWADDIAAVIAAKKLRKPVIVAWSFGGFVTADYLRKYGHDGIAGINFVGTLAGLVAGLFRWVNAGAFYCHLLAIVAFSTLCWLVVTLMTRPVAVEHLRSFYERVRPGGAWGPIAAAAGVAPYAMGRDLAMWAASTIAVFGGLFGLGSFLLGDFATGAVSIGCAFLGGVWLWTLFRAESRVEG